MRDIPAISGVLRWRVDPDRRAWSLYGGRFFRATENPALLPLNAADSLCSRPLKKTGDEDRIIINRSGKSTYPGRNSVQTTGATPVLAGVALKLPGRIVVCTASGDNWGDLLVSYILSTCY